MRRADRPLPLLLVSSVLLTVLLSSCSSDQEDRALDAPDVGAGPTTTEAATATTRAPAVSTSHGSAGAAKPPVTTTTGTITAAPPSAATTQAAPRATTQSATGGSATTAATASPRPKPTSSPSPRSTTAAPQPAGTTPLRIVDFEFRPPDLTVPPGTTVRATNEDGATHDWTSKARIWASGDLRTGQGFSYTFNTLGRFDYFCSIHPTMEGVVTVR